MKLRNKKTGEMGIINYFDNQSIVIYPIDENWNAKGDKKYVYHSLTELNEEWCDYEEPKDFWFIDPEILIACESTEPLLCDKKVAIETMKHIGNYFETKEEAEKAVEKLKAWKRLEEKGFRFEGIKEDYTRILQSQAPFRTGKRYLQFNKSEDEDWMEENWKDLDLLFGGEDE